MIWDQLLSSWAWCLTDGTHNHTQPNEFAYYGGPYPRYLSKMVNSVVGWQVLLTPCLLSTWFGDWLASQSPNQLDFFLVLVCPPSNWASMCPFQVPHALSNCGKPDKSWNLGVWLFLKVCQSSPCFMGQVAWWGVRKCCKALGVKLKIVLGVYNSPAWLVKLD